jgi:SAM-dependent methyltransferase
MLPQRRCYVCGAQDVSLRARKGAFEVYRCAACGLSWALHGGSDPAIGEAQLRAFYDGDYYKSDSIVGYKDYLRNEAVHRLNARHILALTAAHAAVERVRVLDVGCAFGFMLDEARKLGAEVYGAEFSDTARGYAERELALKVAPEFPCADLAAGGFDIAFLIGTIEHLADPRRMLRDIHEVLKPDGVLVITTIDTRGWFPLYALKPPEHLFYFDHRNLGLLLQQTGYTLLRRRTYFTRYLLHDLLHRLGEFFRLPVLGAVSTRMERWAPTLAVKIPTNEMFLVARKQ